MIIALPLMLPKINTDSITDTSNVTAQFLGVIGALMIILSHNYQTILRGTNLSVKLKIAAAIQKV